MRKSLSFLLIIPFFAVFVLSCLFIPKIGGQKNLSFDDFVSAYNEMTSQNNILDGYEEKKIDYQNTKVIDGQNAVEASAFFAVCDDELKLDSAVLEEASALSVGVTKNNVLKNKFGETFALSKVFTQDEKTFLPVKDLEEKLGYTFSYEDESITVVNTFETKRLIVNALDSVQNFGAIKSARNENTFVFQYKTESETKNAFEKIKGLKNVLSVEPDSVVRVNEFETFGQTDSFSYTSWGAEAIHVDAYSNFLLTKKAESELKTVYVAVLDSGIDTDHPWFSGRVDLSLGKNFSDSVSSTDYPFEDGHGHGTHVSGTIVDLTLKNVKIIPVKILNNVGNGYTQQIVNGMKYVRQLKQNNGLNIVAVNMSLGMKVTTATSEYSAMASEINQLLSQNVLSIVSSGNDGKSTKNVAPANVPNAITVAAVGLSGNTYSRPSWSNFGETVDVCAPGNDIVSAYKDGGTISMSGTSMASPHVSACVALICSNPLKTVSPSEVESILKANVLDLGDYGRDDYFGYGMVDLEYAYTELLDEVEFSRYSGACYEPFYLTLSHSNPQAKIYYTLDGSTPTNTTGILYDSPIKISVSTRVRAVAYVIQDGQEMRFSKTREMSYYFANLDVLENYKVEDGKLVEYLGSLTHVIVPEEIDGQPITQIGQNAFTGKNVVSVTLSNNVTKIAKNAFYNCTKLTNIYAPKVTSVGDQAFYNCTSLSELDNKNFGELKTIGKQCFYNCTSLEDITLSKLEYVDYQAFLTKNTQNTKLFSVNFPSLKTIGEEVFVYCTKLTEAILPNVETICSDAFYGCNIESISLPETKNIGNYAFYLNRNLKSVSIPKVETISSYAFYGTSLNEIKGEKVSFIGKYAFYNVSSLEKAEFSTLKEVGEYAFCNATNLNIFKAENLLTVRPFAFYNCQKLESMYLPKIITLDKYCFAQTGLKSVETSQNLSFVGEGAFSGALSECEFLVFENTAIVDYLKANNKSYTDKSNKTTVFSYQEKDNEVYILGYYSARGEITIPSIINGKRVTKILDNAFAGCENIQVLNNPFLVEVGKNAFNGCSNLTYVNLENIQTINDNAFANCSNLQTLNIESVEEVGSGAFIACPKLLFVTTGNNLKTLKEKAFAYLNEVDGVYQIVSSFVLYGYSDAAKNYVSGIESQKELGLVNSTIEYEENYHMLTQDEFTFTPYDDYCYGKISSVQSYVSGNIIIPGSAIDENGNVLILFEITDLAFDDCSFIEKVVLPESVSTIAIQSFKNCSKLKEITLDRVYVIGQSAFEGCDSLKSVHAQRLMGIGRDAFKDCGALEEVFAPNVTGIGSQAFMNCKNLKTLNLFLVASVGARAFWGCESLTDVSLPSATILGNDISSIDEPYVGEVFVGCKNLSTISLGSISEIHSNCFVGTNLKEAVLGKEISSYWLMETASNFNEKTTIYGYSGTGAEVVANTAKAKFIALDEFAVSLLEEQTFAQNSVAKIYAKSNGKSEIFGWYKTSLTTLDGVEMEEALSNGEQIIVTSNNYLEVSTSELGTFNYFFVVANFDKTVMLSNIEKVTIVPSLNVTTNIIGQGVVSPCKDVYVLNNATQEFSITPRLGYYLSSIKVNGTSIAEDDFIKAKQSGIFTLEEINANTSVDFVFEIEKFNVNLNVSENGTASLDKTIADWGTNRVLTLAPNEGFGIDSLKVNGKKVFVTKEIEKNLQFVIEDIECETNIEVLFANKFKVNTSCSENGTITATQTIGYNKNFAVSIVPNKGYYVDEVIVDGVKLSEFALAKIRASGIYEFSGVKTSHDISVSYAALDLKITYEIVGKNGTISFDEQVESIERGDSRTLFIEPDSGYRLKALYVNGERAYPKHNKLTFENITENLNIQVEFEKDVPIVSLPVLIVIIVGGAALLTVCFVLLFKLFRNMNAK